MPSQYSFLICHHSYSPDCILLLWNHKPPLSIHISESLQYTTTKLISSTKSGPLFFTLYPFHTCQFIIITTCTFYITLLFFHYMRKTGLFPTHPFHQTPGTSILRTIGLPFTDSTRTQSSARWLILIFLLSFFGYMRQTKLVFCQLLSVR